MGLDDPIGNSGGEPEIIGVDDNSLLLGSWLHGLIDYNKGRSGMLRGLLVNWKGELANGMD